MPQVERFKFVDNQPATFVKLYANPIERSSEQFGNFHSYTVLYNGVKMSFAAGAALHGMIENINVPVNGSFTITKNVNGQNVTWEVSSGNGGVAHNDKAQNINSKKEYEIDFENEYLKTHNKMIALMPNDTDPDILQRSIAAVYIAKNNILMQAIRNKEVSVNIPLDIVSTSEPDDLPF
jgi:hypothetical protein